jgi:hypothetical protein
MIPLLASTTRWVVVAGKEEGEHSHNGVITRLLSTLGPDLNPHLEA